MSQPIWISKKPSDCALKWAQSFLLFLVPCQSRPFTFILFLAALFSFSGCCSKSTDYSSGILYTTEAPQQELLIKSPPAFYVKSGEKLYNKIGTPAVTQDNGIPTVLVNSTTPTIYTETSSFTTAVGRYTNQIYRIHFSEVPFGWCNLNITTGNNPGLLFIYTFNANDKLVLITTVHSCGCYLAFFPTKELPKESFPPNWPEETQSVYGYTLPAIIASHSSTVSNPYYFTLESGTHRISNITHTAKAGHNLRIGPLMQIQPMENLYHLPYGDESISFFENNGRRAGYVKNNTKILERVLISWWAFDIHVGEDKAYGKSDSSTIPFYTSLKFWQRNNSDMKNFSRFLNYWGWSL